MFPTVDGWNPAPVEVGSLSHHLQGFIYPRWLFGISEPINSMFSLSSQAMNLWAAIHISTDIPNRSLEKNDSSSLKTCHMLQVCSVLLSKGGGPKDIYEYQNISKYELWVNDHILQIPVIK